MFCHQAKLDDLRMHQHASLYHIYSSLSIKNKGATPYFSAT